MGWTLIVCSLPAIIWSFASPTLLLRAQVLFGTLQAGFPSDSILSHPDLPNIVCFGPKPARFSFSSKGLLLEKTGDHKYITYQFTTSKPCGMNTQSVQLTNTYCSHTRAHTIVRLEHRVVTGFGWRTNAFLKELCLRWTRISFNMLGCIKQQWHALDASWLLWLHFFQSYCSIFYKYYICSGGFWCTKGCTRIIWWSEERLLDLWKGSGQNGFF